MLNIPRTREEASKHFTANSSQGDTSGCVLRVVPAPQRCVKPPHLPGHLLPQKEALRDGDQAWHTERLSLTLHGAAQTTTGVRFAQSPLNF